MTYNTQLEFCHFNVRSLKTSFDLFSSTIQDSELDIVGLSETWLNTEDPDQLFNIEGYNLIRRDREDRGGGVAFYIKKFLKCKVVNDLGEPDNSLEQLWVSLNVAGKKLCLGTMYRPPNSNMVNALQLLENNLIDLIPQYDYVMFGGDFNIDFSPLNNPNGYALFSTFLNKYGLIQHITEPTRVTENTSTILDLIISSCPNFLYEPGVFKMVGISDHDMVHCKIRVPKTKPKPFFKTYRDFKNFNFDTFVYDLNNINWDHIFFLPNVDTMLEFLNTNLLYLFDIHAPVKTAKITKAPAPWLTDNLKLMIKLKKQALTKYKKCKSNQSWAEYKELRNLVNMSVKSEKKAYLQHCFRTDPKNFWRTLKYLNVHSSTKNTHFDMAESEDFNNFFCNSAYQADLDNEQFVNENYTNSSSHTLNVERFSFAQVDVNTVENVLHTIKSDAVGPDGISLKMILYSTPKLLPHITFIINQCLATNTFPQCWKEANLIPVPKVSNPTELSHFRPISILPCMSKIFEKIVDTQFEDFISKHNILPSTQSGFRKNHSTNTALLNVTDDIFRATDQGQNTCLVLLDYSKAFDTLDHNLLFSKLEYFGLGQSAVNLFKSYFKDRRQRVFFNNRYSPYCNINKGVAQGSILGPLMFSLYTSDFSKMLKYCTSHQYADDTQLYYSFDYNDINAAFNNINNDLQLLSEISSKHGLLLNENKTQLMIFGKDRLKIIDQQNSHIILNSTILKSVDTCKNLGVVIDTNLRFESHVAALIRMSLGKLRTLYFHKDILDTATKLKLTDSLILSNISYCITVYWPALTQKDQISLQRVQNACLRFCYNVRKYDHITDSLNRSGWLKLRERWQLSLLGLTYKTLSSKQPKYLHDRLNGCNNIHLINTRHKGLFVVPRHNTTQFQRCFTYNAIKTYNELPHSLKLASSLANFKYKTKSYLHGLRDRI